MHIKPYVYKCDVLKIVKYAFVYSIESHCATVVPTHSLTHSIELLKEAQITPSVKVVAMLSKPVG